MFNPLNLYRKLPKFWRDWTERVFWTCAQVVLAVLIKETADLDGSYVPVIAVLLAGLKGMVAKKIGNGESASTDPTL